MRVATYYHNKKVEVEERNIPKIGNGELLLKIHAASICGSDVMEWYRVNKGPRILGHEVSGEIVEIGEGIIKYKKGDRVCASHHVPCYECHYCKLGHHTLCDTLRKTNFDPGGFSELVRLPSVNVRYGVYNLPDNVSFEEGALIEPLACTLRAQKKADIKKEQTVLVIGSGLSGLFHIMLARSYGVKKIITTDINEYRLKVAKEFGADQVFNASEDLSRIIPKINEARLADVVIVCSGSKQAALQAIQLVERGGTILFFALNSPDQIIPISMNEIFWQKGITMMSSYAASPEDHHEALKLIQTGKVQVKKMITHRFPFNEIQKGFDLVVKAQDSLKVIINPTQ